MGAHSTYAFPVGRYEFKKGLTETGLALPEKDVKKLFGEGDGGGERAVRVCVCVCVCVCGGGGMRVLCIRTRRGHVPRHVTRAPRRVERSVL